MQGQRQRRRHIGKIAAKQGFEPGGVRHRRAQRKALPRVDGLAEQRQAEQLRCGEHGKAVDRQREQQQAEQAQAVQEHVPGAFALRHEGAEHPDHAEARREGEVALIDAARKRDRQRREDPFPALFRGEAPHARHAQQQGEGVGRGGEGVAHRRPLGREADQRPGEQHLQNAAFDMKQAHGQADREREEAEAHQPVDPGHGHVGHHQAQQLQPVAAGDPGRALGEEIGQVVVEGQLVGQPEAVGGEAEPQRRKKGKPVLPERGASCLFVVHGSGLLSESSGDRRRRKRGRRPPGERRIAAAPCGASQ